MFLIYNLVCSAYNILSMKPMKLVIELYLQYAVKELDSIENGTTPVDQHETILLKQNTMTQETGSRAIQVERTFRPIPFEDLTQFHPYSIAYHSPLASTSTPAK